jgi:hypothetical protein
MNTTVQTTKERVTQEIADYVRNCGGAYSQWYVGIAADPQQRLFNDHNVDRNSGAWIYRTCGSSEEARAIEDYFILMGMKGGPGGGDSATKIVYAYKITSSTRE